jgi:TrmH family RNA methyltransferase
MEESYIESLQNNHVKNLVKLRERKHRNRQERFIIEGHREIKHAIDAGYSIETLYYCPELFPNDLHTQFLDQIKSSQKLLRRARMHPSAFSKASLREGPDGFIAVSEPKSHSLEQLNSKDPSTILVLEGIEKPGNLGAILRSADGAGVDAVFLIDCLLDIYNPNAIRSSQGLVFQIPIIEVALKTAIEYLRRSSFEIIASSPHANLIYHQAHYSKKTALLMGSESTGLSQEAFSMVDTQIQIPMHGQADSLNVSVATAICLYEIKRQKNLN